MRRLLPLLFVLWPGIALADPFGRPGSAPETAIWLPDPLRPLAGWLLVEQRHLVAGLQHQIGVIRGGGAPAAVLALLAAAAVYGAVHAAGPGHGKMVIAGYFASRRARLAQALKMSGAMAAMQALSAVTVVTLFFLLFHLGSGAMMARAGWFETVSFALVGLFGLYVAFGAVRGVETCCHGHGFAHDHAHHRPDDGHHEHSAPSGERRHLLMGAVAVGLRPCTGALLILLFTYANGLYWLGIGSVAAMAAGSALTVALVAVGAIGVRSAAVRLGGGRARPRLRRAVAVAGGLAIAAAGFSMMAMTWGLGPTG